MTDTLIDINLSQDYQQWRRKQKPRPSLPVYVGIPLCVIIAAYAVFYIVVFFRAERLKELQRRHDVVRDPAAEYERVEALGATLKARANVLEECRENWITWSDRWAEIARIIPEKIYLRSVEIEKGVGAADRQFLRIEGRAFGVADETAILRFHAQLRRSPLFSNIFPRVDLVSVTTEGPNKNFTIELRQNTSPP